MDQTPAKKYKQQWQEGEYTVYRNHHWSGPGCHNACSMLVYVKDGKIAKVEGDLESPYNEGRLCMRCLNMTEAYYHPDRIKYPLKRAGERGQNKWERISWDEAYDIIESKVRGIWKDYGPESIVSLEGTGRNVTWQVPMLSYAVFGSPNFSLGFLSGDSCYLPRAAASAVVAGDLTVADLSQVHEKRTKDPRWVRPEVILIWGNNPIVSNGDGFLGHWIVDAMKEGTRLIVIDPELTWLGAKADFWLQLRPGTDGALALGMLNVIINEGLYDTDFVEKWTFGFDELKERVQAWTPEKVSEITWVPKELIEDAARFYATNHPAALQWGLPIDMHPDGVSAAHALNALVAICGNFDVPGGNIVTKAMFSIDIGYPTGMRFLPEEILAKRLAPQGMHNAGWMGTAQGDTVLEAIENNQPFPVRMLWIESTNPIANMASDAPRVYKAIQKVDFNVVVDYFITPTAVACADLVLPCAMGHERNSMRSWFFPTRVIKKLTQYGECKSDEQLIVDLGNRLNPELFNRLGIKTDINLMDWLLKDNHIPEVPWPYYFEGNYQTLKDNYIMYQDWPYKKYELGLLRPDSQPGFNTPSGRIELKSNGFAFFGYDPLPYWREPPESPISTPELFKEYPFVFTSGQRSYEFFHSEHRQQPTMREFHPLPKVDINYDVALELGIQEGDWVWIENMRGRCRQKAHLSKTLHPKVIRAEHGWWFPEQKAEDLFGVFDSNPNNLTSQCQYGPSGYGAPYKCTICKIYKASEENSQILPTEQVIKMGGFQHA